MSVDRTSQPEVKRLESIDISRPNRIKMSNGIVMNVINAGEQEVVRLDLLFKAGSWCQSHKLQAYFTHRMLREGTCTYSAAEIEEKLDYYGAWLEMSNTMEYAYLTLYSLNKYFEETLNLFESIVKEPTFPEKELKTVLATNLQRFLVNSKKVDFVGRRTLLTALFGEQNPCGMFAIESDYRNINPQMLSAFYHQHYHSRNCSVYLSGKVNHEIISRVENAFGISEWGEYSDSQTCSLSSISTCPEKRLFVERGDAFQSAVMLGAFTITHAHPDFLKLRVPITLLGGYFGSRLMSNIREDKGYTYGISMGVLQYPDRGVMIINTETDNRYVDRLINEIYKEIDRLHHEPVGKEELDTVKNYMLGEMCRSYESPFSLSDAWMFTQTAGLDDDYYRRSLKAIHSVTRDEFQELAQRYICKENLKEVVVGKKMS